MPIILKNMFMNVLWAQHIQKQDIKQQEMLSIVAFHSGEVGFSLSDGWHTNFNHQLFAIFARCNGWNH